MDSIADLRTIIWADGLVSPDEAAALFAHNAAADPADREWTDFFVEAVVTYLIGRGEPKGFVSDGDGDWLIAQIDADGQVDSENELEALVRLFEKAERIPDRLRAYGIAQIEQAVLTGEGPTRRRGALDPGSVNASECALLRRMIFSAGGDAPARVSRAEAEALFRIKDAALGKPNAPQWQTLFVQGVANHVLTDARQPELDRATAVRLDKFMSDHRSSVFGFLGRMAGALDDPSAIRAAFDPPRAAPPAPGSGGFTGEERRWIGGHVSGDGKVDPYEQALLDFIASEAAA